MTIKCLAAGEVGGELRDFAYEPAQLNPLDVEIAISHCGVCHTDIHIIDNEDEASTYPLVPGHEIVGSITKKGSQVRGLEIGQRVGVIGIGGLGHLALQFARAWGCEVTAFSSSADKEEEAREFGASHFSSSVDANAAVEESAGHDLIISTVHASLDWEAYVKMLRPYGKLCFVGAIFAEPIRVFTDSLIWGCRMICGSLVGNRSGMHEMLDFAARHGIEAKTEVVPMSEANAAIEKVRSNRARYRMVLRNSVREAGD